MVPSPIPQPLNRLPEDAFPNDPPGIRRPRLRPVPEPPGFPDTSREQHGRPPGGEHSGRLPGPEGPDRLASGAEPPRRTHAFDLAAVPASVAAARSGVRKVLTAWGTDNGVLDSAVLVTSELVTNALTHSASERIVCRLRLHGAEGRIRLEVEDQNRGGRLPTPRRPDPDDQSGRGLLLVEALSLDWGITATPDGPGRVVWADLTSTAPAPDIRPARPTPHSAEGRLPHGPNPHP